MDLYIYSLFIRPATTRNVNLTKIFIIAHLRGSMLMLWWMLRWFLRVHDRSRVYTVQMCTPGSTYTGSLSTNQRRAEWVTDQWEASIPSALETPASALHQHNSPSVVSWPRGGEVTVIIIPTQIHSKQSLKICWLTDLQWYAICSKWCQIVYLNDI